MSPYKIMVSEIMLQQTQVERVIPKFNAWIKKWPNEEALAQAKIADVIAMWQGLGYNSRAKRLRDAAKDIVKNNAGVFPTTRQQLEDLPGIGPYTSGAIMAFAYDEPVVFIDTNIRRVMLHHFFKGKKGVTDKEIATTLKEVFPGDWSSRLWYWAMMDYGSHLGELLRKENPNRRSQGYSKQSTFAGSRRQVRGAVIRIMPKRARIQHSILWEKVEKDLGRSIPEDQKNEVIDGLVKDGLVEAGPSGIRFSQ